MRKVGLINRRVVKAKRWDEDERGSEAMKEDDVSGMEREIGVATEAEEGGMRMLR